MEITGVTTQVGLADEASAPAKNSTAARANRNGSAGTSEFMVNSSPRPHVLASLVDANYVRSQLDTIMYSFPPFFPVGSPQRVDLIKGINGVKDEIAKSATPPEVKQQVTAGKLTDTSTDQEVIAALKDLKRHQEVFAPKAPVQSGKGPQSALVSLKI